MSTNPNIHFIPGSRRNEILDKAIQSILVVAHPKDQNTNHTCFYLVTGEKESVQFDCIPNYYDKGTIIQSGYKANLVLSELEHLHPEQAEKVSKLNVSEGLKVRDVFDTIIREKRDQYEFTPEGTGCRLWVTGQITLLQKEGFITNQEQAHDAQEAIKILWPDQTDLPLDAGKYLEHAV